MKLCFKCGVIKPYSEFYRHPQMSDGYLGKCKECTKNDSEKRRKWLIENDPIWVIKEAERQRVKEQKRYFETLKNDPIYIERSNKAKNLWKSLNPDKRLAHIAAQKIKKPQGFHNHHWSYKEEHWEDVIPLQSRRHAFVHRYLEYEPTEKCYKTKEGELLNTKEKHMNFLLTLPF